MSEPSERWQDHRLVAPSIQSAERGRLRRHPWGVTVWGAPGAERVEAPTEVVVPGPRSAVGLAWDVALTRLPLPSPLRRLTRALPFGADVRGVRAALVAIAVVLLAAAGLTSVWVIALVVPAAPAAYLLADRLPPHDHPADWRRRGHVAEVVPFAPPYVMADWLFETGARDPLVGEQIARAVRVAGWEGRRDLRLLGAWLGDIVEAYDLVRQIGGYAAASPGTPAVARVTSLVPGGFESLASDRRDERRGAVAGLRDLRDALV